MDTAQNTVSVDAQNALRDMIELQMYLVAQSQQTPWPMRPRKAKSGLGAPDLSSRMVEFSVAKELVDRLFIEATSNRTYVVSESGYRFYREKLKPHSA